MEQSAVMDDITDVVDDVDIAAFTAIHRVSARSAVEHIESKVARDPVGLRIAGAVDVQKRIDAAE